MSIQKSKSPEIPIQRINRIRSMLLEWGARNFDAFPWRTGNNSSYSLIAEVMLQRTKAEKVAEVYQTFSKTFPSLSDASRSDPEKIRGILYPLGLRWRNEKIIQLIKEIAERNGEVPIDKKELMKMAGIGEYVSNAYLSLYKNIKAPITDNNAVRLWSRVFNFKIDTETRKKRWFHSLTDKITPDDSFKGFNFAVLDLTRKICRKKPECKKCPINKECQYFSKQFI